MYFTAFELWLLSGRLFLKIPVFYQLFYLLQAENKNEAPQYDGTWRDADPADVKAKMDAGVPYTYRFKVPKGKVRPETVTVAALEH